MCLINAYTSERHPVPINRLISDWQQVSSGVPEGSVLRPVLCSVSTNKSDAGIESFKSGLQVSQKWERVHILWRMGFEFKSSLINYRAGL